MLNFCTGQPRPNEAIDFESALTSAPDITLITLSDAADHERSSQPRCTSAYRSTPELAASASVGA